MLRSVVIAGAGQAGFQTAASLRQDGFAGRIVIIGHEPGLPYQRPPLSKAYLMGKTTAEALTFRPEKFFADNRIELIAQTRVTAIDRTNKRVALSSGGALDYDHLVLAFGAHNRTLPIPGADLDGVFGLRTLADADAIGAMLADAHEVVVAGAGFIGLEFAAVASALGKSVHVLELADRTMARAISPAMSQLFADAHALWGVKIDFGQGLARIDGDGRRVTGVDTTDGRKRPADIVVFGIGVLPTVAVAAEAGLDIDNGIKVDAMLVTSDPTISAIGDCAAFPSPFADSYIRLEIGAERRRPGSRRRRAADGQGRALFSRAVVLERSARSQAADCRPVDRRRSHDRRGKSGRAAHVGSLLQTRQADRGRIGEPWVRSRCGTQDLRPGRTGAEPRGGKHAGLRSQRMGRGTLINHCG